MAFPIDAIQIDFDIDIEYGQDQAFISYPTLLDWRQLLSSSAWQTKSPGTVKTPDMSS